MARRIFSRQRVSDEILSRAACRVLIDHAFDSLKLNRVEMHCGVENKKSRKIAEKLGFREEGVIRQSGWLHDHFVDYVIYGMLSSEWKDKNHSQ